MFPRIYNPLKDWVTADEAYARKLQDEANDILRRKVQITEDTRRSMLRADDMRTKVGLAGWLGWLGWLCGWLAGWLCGG